MTVVIDEQRESICGGRGLIRALEAGERWLEANSNRINLLNVYPVPDGDTGTNMLLTMHSALAEANRSNAQTVGEVALAIYKGALMGARGNSGVILSQMLRGVAETLAGKDVLTASDLADAFQEASETAYKGVTTPVEGTMLTVIRDVARAVAGSAERDSSLARVMHKALVAGQRSVARTPELLAVLRDAGVVDAGGEGLCVILEGMSRFMRGESSDQADVAAVAGTVMAEPSSEEIQGYCTEFLIAGQGLDLEEIKARMKSVGNSLLVVGDQQLVRVHVHTTNPGLALEFALESGTLHQIKVDNLEDQHREFLLARGGLRKETPPAEAGNGISFVVVANGDGFAEVFKSLGVAEVVYGGETMNPSTDELLQAVERAPTEEVILLPNDRNVAPVAEQVKCLARKAVEVVPTETIPQGISALLAFNYQNDLATNVTGMWTAARGTRTAQVARATRGARLNGLVVEEGQVLGLLDGKPVAVGAESGEVVLEVLAVAKAEMGEVITIYRGREIDDDKAELLALAVRNSYPGKQIELVFGGQPFYDYILSVE